MSDLIGNNFHVRDYDMELINDPIVRATADEFVKHMENAVDAIPTDNRLICVSNPNTGPGFYDRVIGSFLGENEVFEPFFPPVIWAGV